MCAALRSGFVARVGIDGCELLRLLLPVSDTGLSDVERWLFELDADELADAGFKRRRAPTSYDAWLPP